MKRLAVDPGDIHVGWALSDDEDEILTGEWRPAEACDMIIYLMTRNEIDEVILEEFRLYEKNYEDQTWSPMLTSQLIGAIKLICRLFHIPWVEQGATIKTPTRNQLRARRIRQKGSGTHALDAELHLWYRILKGRHKG